MRSPALRSMMPVLIATSVVGSAMLHAEQQSTAGSESSTRASVPDATAVKAFIQSQVTPNWTPPKTPWGHPDLQGTFTTKDEMNTPFERPEQWAGRRIEDITPEELAADIVERQRLAVERAPFAGGGEPEEGVAIAVPIHWFDNLQAANSRPWFVIDPPEGQVPPLTAAARARADADAAAQRARRAVDSTDRGGLRNHYTDRNLGDRCIVRRGLPVSTNIYDNSYQILQTPDHVVIRYEEIHEARIIPLDGRPHTDPRIPLYYGDSRARWEGNTLVVETTNFNDAWSYRGAPAGNFRLIERFTPIAPDRVEWTITFDDPTTWTRPWTYSMPLTEDDTQIIHEYACHEGNYAMPNLLTAGREGEKKGGTEPK